MNISRHQSCFVFAARPSDVPAEWVIFNAPRPLYGDMEWRGDFLHGVFYVAVNPDDRYAEERIKRNLELDAWVVHYHDRSEARAWAAEHYAVELAAGEFTLEDYDESDIREQYLHQHWGKWEG